MCTNHCHRVFTQLQLADISIISICFGQPSVHPQEDLYIQFYGIFSYVHISSLIDGRMCFASTDWNQLPEGAIGTSHGKTHIFKTRVRKVQNSGGSEGDKQ
jgi:hypothetical protein